MHNSRIFYLLAVGALLSVLFLSFGNISSAELFGAGTPENPYEILNCADFIEINQDLEASYILTDDIDCSEDGNDIMIGDENNPFSGSFDGDGYNITINIEVSNGDYEGDYGFGLFRFLDGATIEDLSVDGYVAGTDVNDVGMLAGRINNSSLSQISIVADVEGISIEESIYGYGGLAGVFHGDNEISYSEVAGSVDAEEGSVYVGGVFGITGCSAVISYVESSVNVIGVSEVGGFAGVDSCEGPGSVINDSSATGDVNGSYMVGGFVGSASYVDYEDVYATGDVYGGSIVGGFAGYYQGYEDYEDGLIFHAYATGDAYGGDRVGGFAGETGEGTISQSYATGAVSYFEGAYAGEDFGGFVGQMEETIIRDSYALGNVSGYGHVGGFVGFLDEDGGRISNSYSVGSVINLNEEYYYTGGFVGAYDDEIRTYNLFWDTETSGLENGCGEYMDCSISGKTTSEMKTESTFVDADWNFETIWAIDSEINEGYPHLLGGEDELYVPAQAPGPVETILNENQFHGGGVAQGWNADDNYWQYDLPFTFNFYGIDYDEIFVDSNGYIGFTEDGDMGDYGFDVDEIIGAPIIMALQDDLVTNVREYDEEEEEWGDFLTDIYITDEGDGKVIVRWVAADIDDRDVILNFEIVLHDDNSFEINYGDQDLDLPEDYAVVGVQDGMRSHVASAYNDRNNYHQLNTSAWSWEEVDEEEEEVLVSPNVSSGSVNGIGSNSAILNGNITSIGSATVTNRGFQYGTSGSYGLTIQKSGSHVAGAFTGSLTDLACGTTYYYRAFATNITGTSYGSGKTFTTTSCISGGGGGTVRSGVLKSDNTKTTSPEIQVDQNQGSIRIQSPFSRNLEVGSNGLDVLALQKFLNTHGYPVALSGPGSLNNETGIFGLFTRTALSKFQAVNGIAPSLGYFGPITKSFIEKMMSVSSESITTSQDIVLLDVPIQAVRDLDVGMTGDDVLSLQKLLILLDTGPKAKALSAVGATGTYRNYTKEAVSEYQVKNGIAPISGYFGPRTRAYMKSVGVSGLWW